MSSIAGSFLEVQEVGGWVNASTVINGTAIGTTCSDVSYVFPEIAETFGDDTPLNIYIDITEAGNFATKQSTQMIGASGIVDI